MTVSTEGITYEQAYQGVMECYLVAGHPHCGAAAGKAEFPVKVTVQWHHSALDSNGFLLDNTWFAEYVNAFKGIHLTISCENLLALILRDIRTAVSDRRWHRITAALRGIPAVEITATVDNPADEVCYLPGRREIRVPEALAVRPDVVGSIRQDVLARAREESDRIIAMDGQSGLDIARAEHPDAILVDLLLPLVDGWTVTRKLREEPWAARTP